MLKRLKEFLFATEERRKLNESSDLVKEMQTKRKEFVKKGKEKSKCS